MNSKQPSRSSSGNKVKPKGQLRHILIGALVAGGTDFIGEIICLKLFGISWLPVETVDDYIASWLWVPFLVACFGAYVGFKLGPRLWEVLKPSWDDFI